ncbi:hypothetical protein [Pseudonocardia xishanensis]
MSRPTDAPRPLATTVIGSWPVPEWLARLKTEWFRGRISHAQMQDVHETAIKAALRDQELAGIDIVSDGELRRDNDVDYLLSRMPGVEIAQTAKDFYFDYYEPRVTAPLGDADGPLGLADDYAFTAAQTDRPITVSLTGPFSLAHRIRDEAYGDRRALVLAVARRLNAEAAELAARGATRLQLDEPFLAGYPDQVGVAVEAINLVTADVDVSWGLHVCYGNRYARPSWEGHYDFLFPAVLEARVDHLVLEFARKGFDDLPALARYGWDRSVGVGVIDVKSPRVETPDLVAARIRHALRYVPAERLVLNPDCGLRHLSGAVARAKLAALVAGAAQVRESLVETSAPPPPEPSPTPSEPAPALAQGAAT